MDMQVVPQGSAPAKPEAQGSAPANPEAQTGLAPEGSPGTATANGTQPPDASSFTRMGKATSPPLPIETAPPLPVETALVGSGALTARRPPARART